MDPKDIICINRLLEVYDSGSQLYYKSIVQEIHDTFFAIGVPMRNKRLLPMPPDSKWTFKAAVEDALYYFHGKAIGQKKCGEILLFKITWPEKFERCQRRHFFRLSALLGLHFWVLKEEDDFSLDLKDSLVKLRNVFGEPEKAVAVNMSGGGMLMVTSRRLPRDAILALQIFFRGPKAEETILIQGKVIRINVAKIKGVMRYHYGVKFVKISEKMRDRIINFIFISLRERLRKGAE
jgi:c-di-GMP-binding flagellar brake protein YcgR